MEKITRKEAQARDLKFFFTGKPCIYGHILKRYASSGACVECAKKIYSKTEERKERHRKTRKIWRDKNKAKIRRYHAQWRAKNPDKVAEYIERSAAKA